MYIIIIICFILSFFPHIPYILKRFFRITSVILFILLTIATVSMIFMGVKIDEYKLNDPQSISERSDLINKLKPILKILIERNHNDGDSNWPMDRTRMVIAIQEYYLAKNSYPNSMNDLFNQGFIKKDELEFEYVLKSNSMGWELYHKEYNFKFAEGN